MTLSHEDRETLNAAARIKRSLNRERRRNVLQSRPHEKKNRGRERDPGFCQYIRRQPCDARHKGGCSGPVQHAHISYRVAGIPNSFGRSVKNHDRHGNPLCAGHHDIQTNVLGERPFWAWLGKDAYETAAAHYAAYQGVTAANDPLGGYERERVDQAPVPGDEEGEAA